MAAPVWVKNQKSLNGSAFTLTPTLPSSLTTGNSLLMVVFIYSPANPTVNTPSGWQQAVDGSTLFGFSADCRLYVFVKAVVGGDTAPTLTLSASSCSWHVEISEFSSGVPAVGAAGSTSAGSTVSFPAITTPSADNLLVYVMGSNTDFTEVSAGPSGTTIRVNHQDATFGSYIVIADKTQATAASVSATSLTRSNTQFPCIGHTVALPPAGAAGGPSSGFLGFM
jgi:hypothetical protein